MPHRRPRAFALLAARALLFLSLGCAKGQSPCAPPSGSPAQGALPRLDQTWSIATHNSYWVDRAVPGDLAASGVEERFADQLLVDHARGLELDIHKDPAVYGSYDVFHTQPGNSLCDTLAQCLGLLRAVHYALPQHEAITVVLELKELSDPNFDPDHTVEDLDAILSGELGSLLYRPADLLARCAAKGFCTDDVAACVAAVGWPAVDELRGKLIVGVMGNWDDIGATSTADWAAYALRGPLEDRAAFPMASSWRLTLAALPGYEQAILTQGQLDAAFAKSGLLQVEELRDAKLAPWIAGHGVVRIDGAELPADQQARARLGAQLLQTDLPWAQFDDLGPAIPLRSLRAGDAPDLLREPGTRALLAPPPAGARVFAWARQPAGAADTELESTIASGARADAIGCLRAAAALGQAGETSISLCRVKVAAQRAADEPGDPDAETVIARLIECTGGACSSQDLAAAGGHDAPGDLLQLEVTGDGAGGSCATPRAASSVDRTLRPVWLDLAPPFCSTLPLVYQGLSRTAAADPSVATAASFTGTRRDGSDLPASSFTATLEPAPGAGEPAPAPSLLVVP